MIWTQPGYEAVARLQKDMDEGRQRAESDDERGKPNARHEPAVQYAEAHAGEDPEQERR